tara:strand:- start:371 stop:775 length:405 start_codon:yes stop_codon:yes gene_type:complete
MTRHLRFIEQSASVRINRKFKDDCVVRAIANATGTPYKTVFEDLMEVGLEMCAWPNQDFVWMEYLSRLGWKKNKCPRDSNGKLIKLRNWENHPDTAIVINSRHLTAIVDGVCFDTWDCTYRPVNTYWTQEVHNV